MTSIYKASRHVFYAPFELKYFFRPRVRRFACAFRFLIQARGLAQWDFAVGCRKGLD